MFAIFYMIQRFAGYETRVDPAAVEMNLPVDGTNFSQLMDVASAQKAARRPH